MLAHLPSCDIRTMADRHPGQPPPAGISEYAWSHVPLVVCADGCPVHAHIVERGQTLASTYGWADQRAA